ncbi:hypothetical protein RUND412_008832 [Rhizina undulata]
MVALSSFPLNALKRLTNPSYPSNRASQTSGSSLLAIRAIRGRRIRAVLHIHKLKPLFRLCGSGQRLPNQRCEPEIDTDFGRYRSLSRDQLGDPQPDEKASAQGHSTRQFRNRIVCAAPRLTGAERVLFGLNRHYSPIGLISDSGIFSLWLGADFRIGSESHARPFTHGRVLLQGRVEDPEVLKAVSKMLDSLLS